jgi:hypothetical protein
MLHVDAKGNTGTLLKDTLDDVVFTRESRIGVGVIKPEERLHIADSVLPAIRIADGSQGPGKVLSLNAAGTAQWESLMGSWYATLKNGSSLGTPTGTGTTGWPRFDFTDFEESTPGNVNIVTDSITVPYAATYRITVTGKGHTNRSTTEFLPYINVNTTTTVWSPHMHSYKAFGPLNFGFMMHLALNKDDRVWVVPVRNNDAWANLYTDMTVHVELVK